MKPRLTFDEEVNAFYIYLVDEIKPGQITKSGIPTGFKGLIDTVDLDKNGRILGIEIVLPKNYKLDY